MHVEDEANIRQRGAIAAFLLFLLVIFLVALGVGSVWYAGRDTSLIAPGVHVGDVDLSNLPVTSATERLQTETTTIISRQIPIREGNRTWSTNFADLGLRYDVARTVQDAYAVGRDESAFMRGFNRIIDKQTVTTLSMAHELDEAKLRAFIQGLRDTIDRSPQDASVHITSGDITVTPSQEGRQLDIADTATQLLTRIDVLSTAPIDLKVASLPPKVADADVAGALAEARAWMSHDVTMVLPDDGITLTRAQIAGMIHLTQPTGAPLTATLDPEALRPLLAPLAPAIARTMRDAEFDVKDGALVVTKPSQEGRTLDVNAALPAVTAAIKVGDTRVTIPITVAKPELGGLDSPAVAPVAQKVAQFAGTPLTLQVADTSKVLSPKDLTDMVDVEKVDEAGHPRLAMKIDSDAVGKLMKQLAVDADRPARNARFTWSDNALKPLAPSQDGRQLDQPAAVKAFVDGAQTPNRSIVVPFKVKKAAVAGDKPESLGIKELVAEGTSNFEGSPPERIVNLRRGAELINGSIIAPGEVFSFDDTVGNISKENGFVTGLVIIEKETKDGVGGGICQVSTTVFRAAFMAGVPILERHDHAYAVPYYTQGGYPEGFDATIYSPQLDFRFKNDTPTSLLLQTSIDAEANTMKVSLYGTKTGRVVKMIAGPERNKVPHPPDLRKPEPTFPAGVVKQVDWAHDGFDVTVDRIVTLNGQQVMHDTFKSHAEAWQAIYLVGTGTGSTSRAAVSP